LGDEYIQKQHFKSADFAPMKVYYRNHKKYRSLAKTTTLNQFLFITYIKKIKKANPVEWIHPY